VANTSRIHQVKGGIQNGEESKGREEEGREEAVAAASSRNGVKPFRSSL
jgi:hypothetical protein